MKKILLLIIVLLTMPFFVLAEEDSMNKNCMITVGGKSYDKLLDDNYLSKLEFSKNDVVNITCDSQFDKIYIYYDISSTTGKLNNTIPVGENHFLHELIKLDEPLKEATIKYDDNFTLTDIYVFNGDIPAWVEDWQILDKADLMLMSSHADDEQLFFAGLLPKYSDAGKKIQVVYFTNHFNAPKRYHEQLEGLWTVGIKYYPVISDFPDAWSESFEEAVRSLEKSGYTYDDALKFQVENIRKYKPKVIVGHDEKGEYSHGQHILNTHVLEEAYLKANDSTYDTESVEKYGTHMISKLYLHLYKENQIVMDYDTPLESFGGKTAFQVSQEGFKKHVSQAWTWFTDWIYGENKEITKCTQIKTYNPAYFGLYYSGVGEDTGLNDMFENVPDDPKPKEESKPSVIYKQIKKDVEEKIDKSGIPKYYFYIGGALLIIAVIGGGFIFKKRK